MERAPQTRQIARNAIAGILVLTLSIVLCSLPLSLSASAQDIPTIEETLSELGRSLPAQTTVVSTVAELTAAVNLANSTGGNRMIVLEDGEYRLNNMLHITAHNVMFRSRSGNRDAVILRGAGMTGNVPHIFLVRGQFFTVADVTLGWVRNHGIQIQGEHNADAPLIHHVRFVDTFEQMLKVSYRPGDPVGSDSGIVQYSLFEYPAGIGPQWYIGGVDVHQGRNWIIRGNIFRHIRSPEVRLAEHAIHFWSASRDTHVEGNIIVDCDRGIGFGLGDSGHVGGLIANNMVHTTRDVGIGLESSLGTLVYHNTVFTENYHNSIEYRFAGTRDGQIINNLTNTAISSRNGGTALARSNVTNAQASWFVNPAQGDLHLAFAVPAVVDQGETLALVSRDFDGQTRPQGAGYDIGADEFGAVTPPPPVQHTLTVARIGAGAGAVQSQPAGISCGDSCAALYDDGALVSLSAVAESGALFAGWHGDCQGTGTCQVTMNQARHVTAEFVIDPAGIIPAGEVSLLKTQRLEADRGSQGTLPVVYHGDTLSYEITAQNLFDAPMTLVISDYLSALIQYEAGSLRVNGAGVSDVYVSSDGWLEYTAASVAANASVMIAFDVMVAADAPADALIENTALVTAYASWLPEPVLSGQASNAVFAQVLRKPELEPVPEPTTLALFGVGLLGVMAALRKHGRR